MEITFIADRSESPLLKTLDTWFKDEWGRVDPINALNTPPPILALNQADNTLVGGLAFTLASHPSKCHSAIWINAVLVAPRYRGQGIGSMLVEKAEILSKADSIPELFAYTEIPKLYQALGWEIFPDRKGSAGVILTKSLMEPSPSRKTT